MRSYALLLVSCSKSQSVLTATPINEPVLQNNAYFYLTDQKSFGYSHIVTINQHQADNSDTNDNKKLS